MRKLLFYFTLCVFNLDIWFNMVRLPFVIKCIRCKSQIFQLKEIDPIFEYSCINFLLAPSLVQNSLIPPEHWSSLVEHCVLVHQSVIDYSIWFLQRLRRHNHVTPKNYLDFITCYLKLLKEKNVYILSLVSKRIAGSGLLLFSRSITVIVRVAYTRL